MFFSLEFSIVYRIFFLKILLQLIRLYNLSEKIRLYKGRVLIKDSEDIDIIKNGEVNFVSPSIVFNNNAEVGDASGNAIITEFEGAHVAGVREPAYGIDKAEIKGRCIGSKEKCDITLQKVEAKVSD